METTEKNKNNQDSEYRELTKKEKIQLVILTAILYILANILMFTLINAGIKDATAMSISGLTVLYPVFTYYRYLVLDKSKKPRK